MRYFYHISYRFQRGGRTSDIFESMDDLLKNLFARSDIEDIYVYEIYSEQGDLIEKKFLNSKIVTT